MRTLDEQLRDACLDLEERLRRGDDASAEDYRSTQPDVWRDEDAALELIFTEMVIRGELGLQRSAEEWCRRYPQWRDRLQRLFQIQGALDAEAADTGKPGETLADAAPPEPAYEGRYVGDYELLQEIDRGGMGVVYKARQAGLNRIVAVKMVLAGAHAGHEDLARFRREAEAAARLQHPHIVQIHEIGKEDGVPFLSMELIDGPSLEELLSEWHGRGSTGITATDAARLVRTLAEAMHYAHLQGVVHRDLKPANVLLVRSDRLQPVSSNPHDFPTRPAEAGHYEPKIADFGLAKLLDQSAAKTASGALLGTPSYMAPEQAGGPSGNVGPHTDVYALGGILYELLTGRPPFRGLTMVETLEQVRLRDPVAPRQLQPGVPRDLETICLKCLEKEPARRYATAEALADDLRRCLRGEPIHARPGTLWNRAGKWMKRRPAVTGLLAALVAVIATAFAAVLWQLGETGDALEQAEADASARRVALARFHYGAYEVAKARELLLQCPPRFRDAEWRQAQRAVFAEQHCLRPGVVVRKVFWSTDGRRVIGCSMDGRIFGWDAGTGKPVYEHRWRAPTEPPASQFALSSDGKTLFCLQQRYLARGSRIHVECIRLRDGKTTAAHEFTNSTTGHAAVSRNGRLALHGRDGHARFTTVTDLDSGEEVLKLTHKGRWDARWLQFSPDGTRLVRMVASREITIFDVATGRRVLALTPKSPFRPRAFFDPGGRYVAFGFFAQPAGNVLNLQVFDTESGKRIRSIDCPNVLGALIADIASDPKRIAWTGERSSLNIGNIGPVVVRSAKVPLLAEQETQRRAEQRNQRRAERKAAKVDVDLPLRGHTAAMTDLAFSPDGNRLASCNQDGTVRIWDVRPLE